MAISLEQSGAQSATFYWTHSATPQEYSNWSALPTGKLKSLLSRVYLTSENAVDPDAFWRAFAVSGGSAVATSYLGTNVGNPTFILSDGEVDQPPKGTPILRQLAGINDRVCVRIQTAYSASS